MANCLLLEVHDNRPDLIPQFVNRKNLASQTALHWASKFGRIEFLKVLMLWNADISVVDEDGRTAIELAALAQETDTVAYLRPFYSGRYIIWGIYSS